MKPNIYLTLMASALILGTGCKKDQGPSGVLAPTTNSLVTGFPLNSPTATGRLIPFDNNDGNGLSNMLSYDNTSNQVSLINVSGGTLTTIWTTTGLTLDNGEGTFNLNTYPSTDNYNEIGGVHIIPFDLAGTGHEDYLLVYVPGDEKCAILGLTSTPGVWHQVWPTSGGVSSSGIGGYNLGSTLDKIIAFQYTGTTKSALICYRPGSGSFWVLKNTGTAAAPAWTAAVQSGDGVGGYDLHDVRDQVITVDDPGGTGDAYLALYRPGAGYFWWILHTSNTTTFTTQFGSRTGLAGFPLTHQGDRIIAWDQSEQNFQDNILCYSPGYGNSYTLFTGDVTATEAMTPLSPNWVYPMTTNPYSTTPTYVGDHIITLHGTGTSSGGLSTLVAYTNGTGAAQIYDEAGSGSGVAANGVPLTLVYP